MPSDRERTSETDPLASVDLSEIEQELAAGLCRVPAPEGFADRVMLRVHGSGQPTWSRWAWAIAAMLLVVMLATAQQQRERHRKAEAARTTEQFALAMRITHAALLHAGQNLGRHASGQARAADEQNQTTND